MTINRLVTTKQKRFLEKTFKCLGIDVDEIMEINNIRKLKQEKEELEERVHYLEQALTKTNETIVELSRNVTEFIDEMQQEMLSGGDN